MRCAGGVRVGDTICAINGRQFRSAAQASAPTALSASSEVPTTVADATMGDGGQGEPVFLVFCAFVCGTFSELCFVMFCVFFCVFVRTTQQN